MEPQVYTILDRIHKMLKQRGEGVSATDLAYIIGHLEALLEVYRAAKEEPDPNIPESNKDGWIRKLTG